MYHLEVETVTCKHCIRDWVHVIDDMANYACVKSNDFGSNLEYKRKNVKFELVGHVSCSIDLRTSV
jgi:hypothetical protein